jgi:hypothetical protein
MCLRAGSWLLLFLGATWAAADGKATSHNAIAQLVFTNYRRFWRKNGRSRKWALACVIVITIHCERSGYGQDARRKCAAVCLLPTSNAHRRLCRLFSTLVLRLRFPPFSGPVFFYHGQLSNVCRTHGQWDVVKLCHAKFVYFLQHSNN